MYSNLVKYVPNRKPPMGAVRNPYLSINRGIIGDWPFWGGAGETIDNLSAKNKEGIFSAGNQTPTWKPGNFGHAIDFADDTILLGLHRDFLGTSSTQPFTVIAWAKANAIPAVRSGIISNYDNETGTRGWDLRIENGNAPSNGAVFSVAGFSANAAVFATADFIETEWNQYIGRFDGSNVEVFVNTVLGGTAATATITGTDRNLYIGSTFFPNNPGGPDGGRDFDGLIDNGIIYNRALHVSEMAQLLQEPFCGFRWPNIIELASYVAAAGGNMPIVMQQHNQFNGGMVA